MLASGSTEAVEVGVSRGMSEIVEHEVEPPLSSDVDDMPTRIIRPSHCSSSAYALFTFLLSFRHPSLILASRLDELYATPIS